MTNHQIRIDAVACQGTLVDAHIAIDVLVKPVYIATPLLIQAKKCNVPTTLQNRLPRDLILDAQAANIGIPPRTAEADQGIHLVVTACLVVILHRTPVDGVGVQWRPPPRFGRNGLTVRTEKLGVVTSWMNSTYSGLEAWTPYNLHTKVLEYRGYFYSRYKLY